MGRQLSARAPDVTCCSLDHCRPDTNNQVIICQDACSRKTAANTHLLRPFSCLILIILIFGYFQRLVCFASLDVCFEFLK